MDMDMDPKNPKEENKTNKKKKKTKPVKVVYIANPVKVKASATEFRALVQELTGRDGDPSKYTPIESQTAEPRQAINELHISSSTEEEPRAIEGSCNESSIDMIENYAVFSPPLMLYNPEEYGVSGFYKN